MTDSGAYDSENEVTGQYSCCFIKQPRQTDNRHVCFSYEAVSTKFLLQNSA